ncbi:SDR family oxidoreductase [Kineosporia succinea]|uniref:NAD(P)-dependent dehydrogenase (Short-subunit alcohol dehydrogenase family) n=1 Tax=Kineosporia succinea TaxID=84632 RepID=A0ABT9NVF8_9ACTN|nr:SDR family oxidoreductase [Kineosporia succinea]MDP9824406.1 NAD(P)-dependent dehydrogenase (short-subunit alcohol dehydrogenase family) [Kineosporia succinea]
MSETRTALVTGANKGIGYEIAAQLGRLGFRVGVGSRNGGRGGAAVSKLRAEGVDAFAVPLDVTDDESVAAAATLLEEQGALDVLVNNAGISAGRLQTPSATDLDRIRAAVETNVIGVVRVTNALLPLLRRSSSARIVNVSTSMASLALNRTSAPGSGPLDGAYGPSKTMLNAVTLQYARELEGTGVLVNLVCPGYVATDFTGFDGGRTPAQGAAIAVKLATVPDGGPHGGFFDEAGELPW